jgi:hypothetical protein
MMASLVAVLLFLGGIVLSVVVQLVVEEPIYFVMLRFVRGILPHRPRGVQGIWEGRYRYPSKQEQAYENQLMLLKQVGPFVIGNNLSQEAHAHRLNGRIEGETFLTGTWENISEGEMRHGAYQLVLSHRGSEMKGRWIGFDANNVIQDGPWAWKLLSKDTSKKAQRQVLQDWRPSAELVESCQDNREIARELIGIYSQAWEHQDPHLLGRIFTPEAVYTERPYEKSLFGLSQIKAYWNAKVVHSQANVKFELLDLFTDGDVAVAEWEAEFDDLAEAVHKQMREVAIITISDCKISTLREYWSSREVHPLL